MASIKLSARMANVQYEIRDIVVRAKKVQAATGKKIHWFNIGDPNQFGFKPPEWVTSAIKDALSDPKFSAYCPSDGDPELRAAIGKIEGIAPEFVTIHGGLSEGIDFLFQMLVDPGDNILLPSPSYPLYNTKLAVCGGVNNYYSMDADMNPDTDGLRKKVNARTKAIVVINPNNPTGAVWPRKSLVEISDIASEFGVPIISDEIYSMTPYDGDATVSMRDIVKDVPLVVGNGISKNFTYPGARVGYLAFHNDGSEVLRDASVRLCNSRLSVNWEMQRGALAAFTHPPDHIPKLRDELRKRRDVIYKGLNGIPGITCAKPKAAFYAFPKVETGKFATDKEFVYSLLEETGVLVVPGSSFSPVLPGKYFRLVFLAQPEELSEAIGKIADFAKKRL